MASSKSNSAPATKPLAPFPATQLRISPSLPKASRPPTRKACVQALLSWEGSANKKRNTPSWLPQRATQLLAIKPLVPFPVTQLRISPSLPKASKPPTKKSACKHCYREEVRQTKKETHLHGLLKEQLSSLQYPPGSCSRASTPCDKAPWLLFPRLSSLR